MSAGAMSAGPLVDLAYRHVDVFSGTPLSGNALNVFPGAGHLPTDLLQRITQELRQFEAVFLRATDEPDLWDVRIFSTQEELPFAGHPLLGAAAVLHEQAAIEKAALQQAAGDGEQRWRLRTSDRVVPVSSRARADGGYHTVMDQGSPSFDSPLSPARAAPVLEAFGLDGGHLHPGLPVQVVSTGLRYAVVPVRELDGVQIVVPDLTERLAQVGAQFAYLIDVDRREGRHWENDGSFEDVATGSAAGPVAAYLVTHGAAAPGQVVLDQGRFADRPSRLTCTVNKTEDGELTVLVGGDVSMVASGQLDGHVVESETAPEVVEAESARVPR